MHVCTFECRFLRREIQVYRRASPFLALVRDPSFMIVHNLENNTQAQSRTGLEARMEGLKEVFLLFRCHAYSGVLKCYSCPAILCRCYLYRQGTPLRHGPESVLREIPEDLLELVGISVDRDLGWLRPQDYGVHLPDFGVVFQQGTGIAQQRNQFDR